nr:hypothetical protein [Xenococcaceae cyanobacterium MO_188.B19]
FTHRLFARGFSYFLFNQMTEIKAKEFMNDYQKSITLVEKIKITLMAIYHNRPWKKVQLYSKKK